MNKFVAQNEVGLFTESYRRLADALPCLVLISQGGQLVLVNTVASQLLGETAEALRGTPLLAWIAPEFRERARQLLEQAEQGETIAGIELPMLRRDGATRRFEASLVPTSPEGQPAVMLVGVESASCPGKEWPSAAMEPRLLQVQRLESLGLLAGGVAHDVNNLLSALIGNLDLALLKLPAGAAPRNHLEIALQAGGRAADLMRQLLAYAGRGEFRLREVPLSGLVQENAYLLRACVTKKIALKFQVTPEIVPIVADAGQIQQLLVNLLTNAAEAIGDRSGTITLRTGEVHCDAQELAGSCLAAKPAAGRFVFVEVTDTGCGLDALARRRLFEPFFSTKSAGRGLGMSAVQSILQTHRGALFIDSELGRGTTVRALFPVPAVAEPVAEAQASVGAVPVFGKPATLAGTVLIVDDEEMVRASCVALVSSLGLRAMVAAGGEEAIALYRAQRDQIDCVLLDLTMPKKDGLETFRELRAINAAVKVVLVSGYETTEADCRFAEEGILGFLQKPYSCEALARILQRILAPCG